MEYQFNVWVKFMKNGESCGTGFYTSSECFEDCWDRVSEKTKSIQESDPDTRVYIELINAYATKIDHEQDKQDDYLDYEEDFDE